MASARTGARTASKRHGNCRRAASGAWIQRKALHGVRRKAMAAVRRASGRVGNGMLERESHV